MPLILLTNDDGIAAEGLACLEEALKGLGDLIVVAPDRERSAVSHGLTIHSPLSLEEVAPNRYRLSGTPADCVIYALRHLVDVPPLDLVVSGINHGANLGDDIMYSGTVAAAREASRHGIPAIAISQAYDEKPIRFREAGRFAHALVKSLLSRSTRLGVCLNVNIPVRRIRGVKVTRQGCTPHYPHHPDAGSAEAAKREQATPQDFHAILDHYVSVTPLHRDQTDYAGLQMLAEEESNLFGAVRLPGIGLIGWKN